MKIFTYIFWSFYKKALRNEESLGAYLVILYIYAGITLFIFTFKEVELIPKIDDYYVRRAYGFVILNIIAIPIYLLFPYKKIKNLQYTPEQKYLYNKILLFGGAALFLSICFGFIWDVIDWIKQGFEFLKNWILSMV